MQQRQLWDEDSINEFYNYLNMYSPDAYDYISNQQLTS